MVPKTRSQTRAAATQIREPERQRQRLPHNWKEITNATEFMQGIPDVERNNMVTVMNYLLTEVKRSHCVGWIQEKLILKPNDDRGPRSSGVRGRRVGGRRRIITRASSSRQGSGNVPRTGRAHGHLLGVEGGGLETGLVEVFIQDGGPQVNAQGGVDAQGVPREDDYVEGLVSGSVPQRGRAKRGHLPELEGGLEIGLVEVVIQDRGPQVEVVIQDRDPQVNTQGGVDERALLVLEREDPEDVEGRPSQFAIQPSLPLPTFSNEIHRAGVAGNPQGSGPQVNTQGGVDEQAEFTDTDTEIVYNENVNTPEFTEFTGETVYEQVVADGGLETRLEQPSCSPHPQCQEPGSPQVNTQGGVVDEQADTDTDTEEVYEQVVADGGLETRLEQPSRSPHPQCQEPGRPQVNTQGGVVDEHVDTDTDTEEVDTEDGDTEEARLKTCVAQLKKKLKLSKLGVYKDTSTTSRTLARTEVFNIVMEKLPVRNYPVKIKSVKKSYESRMKKNWGMNESECIRFDDVIESLKIDRMDDAIAIRNTQTSMYLHPLVAGGNLKVVENVKKELMAAQKALLKYQRDQRERDQLTSGPTSELQTDGPSGGQARGDVDGRDATSGPCA